MPTRRFHHTVSVDLSPEHVWAALQRPSTWQHLGPIEQVSDAVVADDGTLRSFRWLAHAGGRDIKGTATTRLAEPWRRFEFDLDAGEIGGSLEAVLEPATRITVTLEIATRGPLAALFFPVIAEALGRGFSGEVEQLAGRL